MYYTINQVFSMKIYIEIYIWNKWIKMIPEKIYKKYIKIYIKIDRCVRECPRNFFRWTQSFGQPTFNKKWKCIHVSIYVIHSRSSKDSMNNL